MESINKDILSELAKYLTSFDIKYLFFALPFLINEGIYSQKLELESRIIDSLFKYKGKLIGRIIDNPDAHFCYIIDNIEIASFDDVKYIIHIRFDSRFFRKACSRFYGLANKDGQKSVSKQICTPKYDDEMILFKVVNYPELIKIVLSPEFFDYYKVGNFIRSIQFEDDYSILKDIISMNSKKLTDFKQYSEGGGIDSMTMIKIFSLFTCDEQKLFLDQITDKFDMSRFNKPLLTQIHERIISGK